MKLDEKGLEAVARFIAKFLGRAWEGLEDGSIVARGFPIFNHHPQTGWNFQGGKADLITAAEKATEAYLSATQADCCLGLTAQECSEVDARHCLSATPASEVEPVKRFEPTIQGLSMRKCDDGAYMRFTDRQSTVTSLQDEIERLKVDRDNLRRACDTYTYLSRDGNPVLAKDLEARADAAEAQLAEVREKAIEALEFYADERRYKGANQNPIPDDKHAPRPDYPYMWSVDRDDGDLARAALLKLKEGV